MPSYLLSIVATVLGIGLQGICVTAEPLRRPLRLIGSGQPRSDSNDVGSSNLAKRYRIHERVKALTNVQSPFGKKERDAILDFLQGDDEFSMKSAVPSDGPSLLLSNEPSRAPSNPPTAVESLEPTETESIVPSQSVVPSMIKSSNPTFSFSSPSFEPSGLPSKNPSSWPSESPSENPSFEPSSGPSVNPSTLPSDGPSLKPSVFPSENPSSNPSIAPSESPSEKPSQSSYPSSFPTVSNFTDDFIDVSPIATETPSASPTLGDCLISKDERAAQILALLDAAGDAKTIRDQATPQGLAADWLIHQDFRKECPSAKIVQRWVTAVLYFSTEGEFWEKCSAAGSDPCGSEFPFDGARRFLSDFSECEWAGITCNNDDCVTEIEFEENGLVGTIPTELGLLTELAVLGMERGGLSSTIPSELGLLTKLVFVDLDFNELTGSLPATLYSLTNLETLDLNDNFLEGNIGSIGVFSNLGFLQLQSNQLTGTIPADMGNLTELTTFNLHENSFTGTMPESVCDLRETNGGLLKSLIADCGNRTGFGPDIECDCCSSCRG